jgi:hypothetical protein
MVSALPPLALQAGGNRVVKGVKIEHVCGDPSLGTAGDAALRRRIVERCLDAVRTPIAAPTLFGVEHDEVIRRRWSSRSARSPCVLFGRVPRAAGTTAC